MTWIEEARTRHHAVRNIRRGDRVKFVGRGHDDLCTGLVYEVFAIERGAASVGTYPDKFNRIAVGFHDPDDKCGGVTTASSWEFEPASLGARAYWIDEDQCICIGGGEDGIAIAQMTDWDCHKEVECLVHKGNAHEKLVEACKIIVAWARGNDLVGISSEPPGIQEAIQALKLAKGE